VTSYYEKQIVKAKKFMMISTINWFKDFLMYLNDHHQKKFEQFTETELDAFFGILIAAGVLINNKNNLEDVW